MTTKWLRVLAALLAATMLIAACGDDDDTTVGDDTTDPVDDATDDDTGDDTDDDAGDGEITEEAQAYCANVDAMDESEEFPSPEQIQATVDSAPEEIAEEADIVGETLIGSEGDFGAALADAEFREAFNALEVYESENCGPSQAEVELLEAEGEESAADGAEVVPVTAVDYAFETEDSFTAGSYAFEVTNGGEAGHEAFMARLADGTTLQEVLDHEGDPFEAGLVTEDLGGVFIPAPGDSRFINAELEAGTYAIVCFIPGPEGTPHAFLGMARELTVT